jgi:hypothetical protein
VARARIRSPLQRLACAVEVLDVSARSLRWRPPSAARARPLRLVPPIQARSSVSSCAARARSLAVFFCFRCWLLFARPERTNPGSGQAMPCSMPA